MDNDPARYIYHSDFLTDLESSVILMPSLTGFPGSEMDRWHGAMAYDFHDCPMEAGETMQMAATTESIALV